MFLFKKNNFSIYSLVLLLSLLFFSTSVFAKSKPDIFLSSNINTPKIYLEGDISKIYNKNDKRKVFFRYEDGEKVLESYAKIKIQGATSLNFEKKNYTIDFYDDNYKNKKELDLGWGSHDKYALKANWGDVTHARNIVTANIVSEINQRYNLFVSTPNFGEVDGYPVEVYLNGDFFGLYTLNIPKSDWLFNMDKNNIKNMLFSSDWWADSNFFKAEIGFGSDWDLEIGDDEGYAVVQINKAINFVVNSTDQEFRENLDQYFSLDNLLNYYVMAEFACLPDNVSKNMLVGSYDGGQKWFLSLYDLDISWGVYFDQILNYRTSSGIENNLLFKRLRENFPNEIANRYFALRKSILTKENILDKFYKFDNKISWLSLKMDQNKWGRAVGFDISQIEDFLDARIPFTDQFFYNFYTIEPTISLIYENVKNNDSVKVAAVANREDIIINDSTEKQEYTFFKNGVYKISYQDWFGDKYTETLDVEISSIDEPTKNLLPYIMVGVTCVFFCLSVVALTVRRLLKYRRSP